MQKIQFALTGIGAACLVSGCTGGNAAQVPPFQSVNVPAATKLEFAVGTANLGGGSVGLNTVVSFRQSSGANVGLAGTLVNTPSITGPAGFKVPAVAAAGTDAGTAHITGQAQTPNGSAPPPPATFSQSGGAFEYGFAPANAGTSGSANYPQFNAFAPPNNALFAATGGGAVLFTYPEPLYAAATVALPYIGGPPAYPFFQDGTQQPGFIGYPSGFTAFAGAAPVAGTYALKLAIPGNSAATASVVSTSAHLSSIALLPALPAPTFLEDGAGGGTASIVVPPGITETLVYVVDISAGGPNFYTLEVKGTGALQAVLPANLGPAKTPSITPPTTGANATPGDPYFVYAAGFDYPALEAAPPVNLSAAPVITGTNGQADVTLSATTAVAAYASAFNGRAGDTMQRRIRPR